MSKASRCARRWVALSAAAATALGSINPQLMPTAHAASGSWTGGGGDNLWSTTGNWTATPVPGSPDTATFNAAAGSGGAIINTGNISLTSLNFDLATAAAYTIGTAAHANTITLTDTTAASISLTAAAGNSQIINDDLILGTALVGTTNITNLNTTKSLSIAGNITGGTGGTAAAKTLNIAAGAAGGGINLSGNISTGGASALSLVDAYVGNLTLSGANTYSNTTQNAGTITLGSTTALPSTSTYTVGAAGTTLALNLQTFNNSISGLSFTSPTAATTLTLSGTGVLSTQSITFNGAGAFTDTLAGGTINLGAGGTIDASASAGATGASRIISSALQGSNVNLKSSTAATTSNQLTTFSGNNVGLTGSVNIFGLVNFSSQAAASNQTLIIASAGSGIINSTVTFALNNNITLANSAVFRSYGSETITLSGQINGASPVQIIDLGTVVFSGPNTFTGQISITNGALQTSSINSVNGGTPLLATAGLGDPTTVANGTINLGSTATPGNLIYTGTGETTDRVLNLAGTTFGGIITQSGTGNLKFTSALTATGAGIKVLTLQGSTAGTGEIAGAIVDNSAGNTTGVTKTGTGAWTLSGLNTYTGPTTISQGALIVNSSISAASTVTVGATAGNNATLAGSGTIPGVVVLSAGTAFTGAAINPGTVGTVGTLSLTNATGFTANAFSRLNFDVTANPAGANDLISSSAVPNINGLTQINLNALATLTTGSVYTLVNGYTGTAAANLVAGTITGDATHGLYVQNNAGSVSALITAATPATAFWSGAVNGDWASLNTTTFATNWSTLASGGTDTLALPGPITNVHFVTTSPAAATLTTNLSQNLAINSLTFDSSVTAATTVAGPGTLAIVSAAGITNNSAAGGAVTIGAPLAVSGPQSWTNNNTTNPLTASGLITLGGALTVTGSGNTVFSGPIVNTTSGGTLIKTGTGTLTLSGLSPTGANNFNSTTFIDTGTIAITTTAPTLNGAVTFGLTSLGTNHGALDLSTSSATIGGNLLVQTNSTTANTITIGAGQTLTLTGGLTMGVNEAAGGPVSTSALTVSGAVSGVGTLNFTGGVAQVGVSQTTSANATNSSTGVLDVTGIGSFTANVTNFNVGFGQDVGGTVKLSNFSNTITATSTAAPSSTVAAALTVGGSAAANQGTNSLLTLGTGTNVIAANTVQIGVSKGIGTVQFASQTALSPGTLNLGLASGTTPTALDIGDNLGTSTAATATGTLDLRGHNVTVNAGAIILGGGNNTGTGGGNGTLSFDTGTFSATSLNLGSKAGTAGTGAATGVLNIGGVAGGGTGVFTVQSGGSFILATNSAATGTGVGTINIVGGTLVSNVPITKGGGTGTTATITLNGGTLDVTGHAIGSSTVSIDALNLQSGTLQNVSQINNGAAISKTTAAGTLILAGTNTFTNPISVNAGTLLVNTNSGSGLVTVNGSIATPTPTPGILGGVGTIAGGVTLAATTGATTFAQGPVINPRTAGTIGTLSMASLTTNNFSNLNFDVNSSANDLIASSAVPIIGATTQVNINTLGTLSNGTVYTLIGGYTGTMPAASFNNLSLNNTFTGVDTTHTGTLLNASGAVDLVIGTLNSGPTTAYWSGAIDGNWNTLQGGTATNWRTDAGSNIDTGAVPGTLTDVHFVTTSPAVATPVTTALGQNFAIQTLNFDSTSTNPVTIAGPNTLTIIPASASTGITLASGAAAVTISAPLVVGATQTWTNGSGNLLTVGAVSGAALTVTGNGSLAQTGVMATSALTFDSNFTGTATLNQANTIGGVLAINNGIVIASTNAGALGAGTLSLGGGTLVLTGASGTNINFGRNTTVTAPYTITADVISSGAGNTYNLGSLSIGAQTLTVAGGPNVTGGTAGLGFTTVTLSGSPTFTVNNPLGGGNTLLTLPSINGTAQNLIFNGTGSTNVPGVIATTTGNVTMSGTGSLTLGGANTFTGNVTLNSGTLNLNNAAATGTAAGTFTIAGGTLDNTSGASITTAAKPLALNGDFTFNGGAGTTHDLNLGAGAITLNNNRIITANAGTLTLGGAISGAGFNITKAGAGTLSLPGVIGTTSGGLAVTGGTLLVGSSVNTFTGPVTVDGANTILQVNGAASTTTTGPLGQVSTTLFKTVTLTNGGSIQTNTSWNFNALANASQGLVLLFGTGGGSINVPTGITTILDDGTTAAGTAAGAVSSSEYIQNLSGVASTTVNKTGLGTLQLALQNLFAGTLNVNAGLVQPTGADTFGLATNSVTVASGAAIDLNGKVYTRTNPLTLSGTGLASAPKGALTNSSATATTWVGPITIATGGATIGMSAAGALTLSSTATINTAGNTLTFNNLGTGNLVANSVISGLGSVVVSGTGQYVPNANSTYSGGTSFSAGSSTIPQNNSTGNPGAVTAGPFGTGTLTFVPTAQIRANANGTPGIINNNVTLAGGVTFLTAATESNFTLGGPVTLTGGNATINSTVGNTTAGKTAILSGAIGDGGSGFSLTKTGTGNLTLGGANTYTGGTIVSAGTLFLSGSLASNTPLTVAGGASLNLQNNAVNPLSVSTLSLGAGAGITQLSLDAGTLASFDKINASGTATTANSIYLNVAALAGFGAGTYPLITAAGGLNSANYVVGAVPTGFTYSINKSATEVDLVVVGGNPSLNSYFWRGSINGSWSASSGGNTNWATDNTGATNSASVPAYNSTVVFSATNATGPAISTTLDASFAINDLRFTALPAAVSSVTIAAGTGLNTLTLTPQSPSTGIALAQGAGAVTISAPVSLGAPQTWSVDSSTPASGTASSLTVSGPISGAAANGLTFTTTAGTAPITLSSATGATYSGPSTVTANTIVQGGATNAFSPNTAWTINGTLSTSTAATGFSQTTGSLVGGNGVVQNGHATTATTLTIGSDNLALATFAGTIQNGGAATLGITKAGTGTQILSGANTYTGATTVNSGILQLAGTNGATAVTVNAGTIQMGNATALTSLNAVTLAGTGTFDLLGNSLTIGTLTSGVTTSAITDTGTGTGTDVLTIAPALGANINALITDGPARKIQIIANNGNTGTTILGNTANTFSGGLVLANNASGTRLDVLTVNNVYGTGPIIVGQAATDKAGIFFPSAVTFNNPIIMNTALGTDRPGIRVDAAVIFSNTLTANLAPVDFSTNGTGTAAVNGQITGPSGLTLDGSTFGTSLTVTLNNGTANPNNYVGDTNVTATGRTMTLALGKSNQIPNGAGAGNVILTASGGGVAMLNLGGFNATVNGLSGNGTVDGASGTPTFTFGNNNATAAFSGVIQNTTGTLTVTKIGTGTQTLSGASTFAGPLNVNGGLVAFPAAPLTAGPLGNSTVINLNGGGISYTASGLSALNRPVAIGAGNGTIDVSSSTGTLNISSVTSTGGNLIKTGPGIAAISGSTTLNGGNSGVTVTGGTLQAGFGANGVNAVTVGSAAYLSMANSAIEALTLGNSAGALTVNGGGQLGFELNGSTNDSIAVGAAGTAVTGGNITLNFIPFGAGVAAGATYNLITAPAGLSGATYSLGTAPNGFNYTINATDTLVSLTTVAFTPIYWRGGQNLSWSTLGTAAANWTSDPAGASDSNHTPAASETVIFSATGAPATGNTITTTLDAPFTIDSLQFSNVPTGITAVTINPGSGGALTLTPASTSGGIRVLTGGGNVTIAAPLTTGAAQTWDVDPTGSLTVSGNTTFNAAVTKTNTGALTLSGTNSGTGSITLTGGTLNINSTTALGNGPFNINAGTTIDNTSSGAITLTSNNVQSWNGDFTFTGTKNLDLGAGAVTLGNSLTVTTTGGTLTVDGAIGGAVKGLAKNGAGALVLNGNDSYGGLTTVTAGTLTVNGANSAAAGGVTLTGGTLNLGNPAALGTGTFTINGGTLDNTSGAAFSSSDALAINGSFTFTGSSSLSLGGATTLTITPTVTVSANTLTLNGNIGGAFGITKAGAGLLTLAGNDSYTGQTTVNAGTLNLSGSLSSSALSNVVVNGGGTLNISGTLSGSTVATTLSYGATAGNAFVNVTGGTTTLFATQGASAASANSIYNQTGGTVTVSPGTGNSQFVVKATAGAYGYFNLTGGTYKDTARFDVTSAANTPTSVGAVFVGGTNALLDNTNGEWFINGYGLNSTTVAAGGTVDRTGASNNTGIFMDSTVAGGAYGVLNVAGGNFLSGGHSITFGNSTTNDNGNSGFLNVAGGTLSVGANIILTLPAAPTAINNAYLNFAGGTVKATATVAQLIPATGASANVFSTIYGPIDNSALAGAPSFAGGLTVDTNTFNITITTPLSGATGVGVNAGNLTVTQGSGYVGAPVVQFTGGTVATGGSPAQGYALIDANGHVTGIVITDPGSYTAAPTGVTLTGGGGTGAAVAIASTTANTSGGLTKINTGSLILSGANTYTGATTISGGVLQLGAAGTTGSLSPSSAISIASGATFAVNRTNAVVQGTDFSGAAITGQGSVLVTGATGIVTLNAANSYSGGTTVGGTTAYIVAANSSAIGTGQLNLNANPGGPGVTFQLNGGITIANPIAMDSTTGREAISSTNGSNTLGGNIIISAATTNANALILSSDGAAGTTFTVNSNITAPASYTGGLSLRGTLATDLGVLNGTVNLPAGTLENNVGGVWTITSTGNTWTQTQFNGTVAGSGINLGANNALCTTAEVLWGATSNGTLDLKGFSQTVAGIAGTLATPVITNSGTADSTLTLSNLAAATLNYTGVISDGSTNKTLLTLNSPGKTQILSGANTYTGATTITAGTLQLGGGGSTGSLSPSSAITDNGTFTINRNNAVLQGTDFSSAPITGSGNFVLSSTPTVTLTANNSYAGGTIIAAGATLVAGNGGTSGAFGTGAVANAGTLTFNRTNNYTLTSGNLVTGAGVTVIASGTVTAVVDNQFNTTGALNFGAADGATTSPVLDLTNSSSTFAGLLVRTNSTGNVLTIGPGKTLSILGNVQIGPVTPAVTATVTTLTMNGGGSLNVTTPAGGLLQAGNTASATLSENSILDLTGLNSVAINVSATGTVRINQPSGANIAGNQASLLLPRPTAGVTSTTPVTTITAGSLNAGDNGGNNGAANQTNAITLGTGLTTLNVNTVNVGTGGRDLGQITFNAGNGTVKLRAADGVSRAAFNIGTGTANTAVAPGTGVTNNVDFTGHSADLLISTLAIGAQNRNTNRTDSFSVDTGTLDVTTIQLSTNSGAANATAAAGIVNTSNLNIGGSETVTIGAGGVDIANGATAVTAASTHSLVGNFNVTGGTVTVANNSTLGAAIRLSNNAITAGLTTAGLLNITGGTVTLSGNIIKGSVAGPSTATLTLNGGLLDLTGHNIGGATAIDAVNLQSGTLQNVAQINNGGAISKTTAGTLFLQGTNSFTSPLSINAGILNAASFAVEGTGGTPSAIGASSNAATNLIFGGASAASAVLQYTGASNQTTDRLFTIGNASGDNAAVDSSGAGTLNFNNAGAVAFGDTNVHTLTFQGTNAGANTFASRIADNTGATSVVKAGSGAWTLTGGNTYSGGTQINAGVLFANNANPATTSATGSGPVVVNGTLAGSGSIAGAATINGNLAPAGNGTTPLGVGPLTLAGGATFNAGSKFTVNLVSPTTPGVTYDQVVFNGPITQGTGNPTPTLVLNDANYINSAVPGDVFWVMDGGSSANANQVPAGLFGSTVTDASGYVFQVLYNQTDPSGAPGNVELITPSNVPEPGTLGLFGVGALGLLARRRRKIARR